MCVGVGELVEVGVTLAVGVFVGVVEGVVVGATVEVGVGVGRAGQTTPPTKPIARIKRAAGRRYNCLRFMDRILDEIAFWRKKPLQAPAGELA